MRRCILIIAGGYYHELCDRPRWNASFGSGGRAAAALVGVTPHVELYTYCQQQRLASLKNIQDRGISLHVSPSLNEFAFAYLHPLSRPGIAPKTSDINREDPIICQGNVILRFGFLEGDAVVHGDRVIYDPQSNDASLPFSSNGSSAKSLALVLNENELRVSMPGSTTFDSAKALMVRDQAQVAVIKCGPNGAAVLEKGQGLSQVPAFRTPRVFKIGSGDVFSAAFAHYWGIEERTALEAAELASRSTAAYCSSRRLPIPTEKALPVFPPARVDKRIQVCIVGSTDTLPNQWLVEESKWCISQLGRRASTYDAVSDGLDVLPRRLASVLILADTLEDSGERSIERTKVYGLPSVVLRERENPKGAPNFGARTTNDFTTALYWTAWT